MALNGCFSLRPDFCLCLLVFFLAAMTSVCCICPAVSPYVPSLRKLYGTEEREGRGQSGDYSGLIQVDWIVLLCLLRTGHLKQSRPLYCMYLELQRWIIKRDGKMKVIIFWCIQQKAFYSVTLTFSRLIIITTIIVNWIKFKLGFAMPQGLLSAYILSVVYKSVVEAALEQTALTTPKHQSHNHLNSWTMLVKCLACDTTVHFSEQDSGFR